MLRFFLKIFKENIYFIHKALVLNNLEREEPAINIMKTPRQIQSKWRQDWATMPTMQAEGIEILAGKPAGS